MKTRSVKHVAILIFACCLVSFATRLPAAEPARRPLEYRDRKPTIDTADRLRILSRDKAGELEGQVQAAYEKLAPTVVRLWSQGPDGRSFDEQGRPTAGALSGVIISKSGLILTCAHHGEPPKTPLTIELADGRRVKGSLLGRFETQGAQPDLGMARIDEEGEWPAAAVGPDKLPEPGTICLGIGYPGVLPPAHPPQLRVGRTMPVYPEYPWLLSTTSWVPGDSGGPLFDLEGRVLGVVNGGEHHAPMTYQPVAPLSKHRAALEAGEIVSAPTDPVRAARTRTAYPPAFAPAPDLEDNVQPASMYVTRVLDGSTDLALGLVVDPEGWVVTKRTLVLGKSDLRCSLAFVLSPAGSILPARIAAESIDHDVALLKLDGKLNMQAMQVNGFGEIRWANEEPRVGQFVGTIAGRFGEALQFTAVGSTVAPLKPASTPAQIFLDVGTGPKGEAIYQEGAGRPPGINFIHAEADEFRHLFRNGDVITHLGPVPTPSFEEYVKVLERTIYAVGPNGKPDYNTAAAGSFAGEPLVVRVLRGDIPVEIRITRVSSAGMSLITMRASPLSRRRDGFPAVFAHDGRVRPEQCGGPLVDLDGRVVGLNIARSDATRTLAIPAEVLQKVVAELREKAVAK